MDIIIPDKKRKIYVFITEISKSYLLFLMKSIVFVYCIRFQTKPPPCIYSHYVNFIKIR